MRRMCASIVMLILFSGCSFRSAVGWLNAGNEAYRGERTEEARECYIRALDCSRSDRFSALLYFQLGNCCVKEWQERESGESGDRLQTALEFFCLAEQFYGEPFPEAAINAHWVRLQLLQNPADSKNEQKQDSEQSDSNQKEQSDSSSSPQNNEGQSSQQNESNQNSEEQSNESSSEERDSSTDKENENGAQSLQAAENGQQNRGENDAESENPQPESALSPEEREQLRSAIRLLEEEAQRRQRPSFQRLPSYDDTEKNW